MPIRRSVRVVSALEAKIPTRGSTDIHDWSLCLRCCNCRSLSSNMRRAMSSALGEGRTRSVLRSALQRFVILDGCANDPRPSSIECKVNLRWCKVSCGKMTLQVMNVIEAT